MKRKMILRYGKKSFNETKQPKLGYFEHLSIRITYFTKIVAQQHFVYLIFHRHKILSNQKLDTFPKAKLPGKKSCLWPLTTLNNIVEAECYSPLLTTLDNVGSTTLFNPVHNNIATG